MFIQVLGVFYTS